MSSYGASFYYYLITTTIRIISFGVSVLDRGISKFLNIKTIVYFWRETTDFMISGVDARQVVIKP